MSLVCIKSLGRRIAALADKCSCKRCRHTYNYLITSESSSYRNFIEKRENFLVEGTQINMYNLGDIEGVECCLWPSLYPFTTSCESVSKGNESRLSR